MDIKDIIKELNHICEDIYELHNLLVQEADVLQI